MLPRERVIASLEHREPDRIPWGEHSIDANVYEDILGRPTLVQAKMRETIAYWQGRRDEVVACYQRDVPDLVRALDMDIVTVFDLPPKGYRPRPMEQLDEYTYRDEEGSLYRVSTATDDLMPYLPQTAGYRPPTREGIEAEIDALAREPADDPLDSRWDLVRHAVSEMKRTHFVLALSTDLSFPGVGATEEDQWISLIEQPELCAKVAELQGRRMLREVALFARLGVDGIMPCGDLGSSTGMLASPSIYRKLVLPWHRAHAAEARRHGLKILKHCCGHVWPVIDDLAEVYDAYEGIQASGGMDIRRLKERVGDRLCLWGGIWHEHIVGGTVEDIREDARYSFTHAAPGGGYIMGSSHSLSVGARPRNILEMKRCRDDWGTYPIRIGRRAFTAGSPRRP
jgi:hypothetical protein